MIFYRKSVEWDFVIQCVHLCLLEVSMSWIEMFAAINFYSFVGFKFRLIPIQFNQIYATRCIFGSKLFSIWKWMVFHCVCVCVCCEVACDGWWKCMRVTTNRDGKKGKKTKQRERERGTHIKYSRTALMMKIEMFKRDSRPDIKI